MHQLRKDVRPLPSVGFAGSGGAAVSGRAMAWRAQCGSGRDRE